MYPEKIRDFLNKFEKRATGHIPTPIEKLPNISKALGAGDLFIKRDDCTGLGLGGNKTRKLEYLIADAMASGCTTVFTTGGIQSNHARQTAAIAAKYSLNCELFLTPVAGTPERNYNDNGNVLLDELFGAKIIYCDNDDQVEIKMEQRSQELGADKCYLIPVGGSNPVGTLGYIECAYELLVQSQQLGMQFDSIVIASGSAGTQAGLVAGLEIAEANIPVYGICVSREGSEQEKLVLDLLEKCHDQIGTPKVSAEKVMCNGGYYYPSYGVPNETTLDAIRKLAENEAILLDPVYTGKAMAGLLDRSNLSFFEDKKNTLFIHTGGQAGLFAYTDVFGS